MGQEKNSSQNSNPAEVYEQFFTPYVFRHWTPMLLEFAQPKAGEHVLDLACGTGIVARFAAKRVNPHGRIVGVDINPSMLEVARKQAGPEGSFIEWQEGNAEDLPFPGCSFDLVVCQAGLMLFNNKAAAAGEMCRVLKPGGRAAVMVWQSLDRNPFSKALNESLSRRMGVEVATISPSFSLGDSEALRGLLSGAGFAEVRIYPVQYYVFVEEPDKFMDLNLKGAAAAIPIYATLDEKARAELAEGVASEMGPLIQQFTQGERLIYPVSANIALAQV